MKKKKKRKSSSLTICLFTISFLMLFILTLSIVRSTSSTQKDTFKMNSRVAEATGEVKGNENIYQVKGWVQVQGTSIDLPILYHPDGDYPVELEGYGWLSEYQPGFHNHFTVTGHNIFNLSSHPEIQSEDFSRFESLMAFMYYDFAKENRYIQFTYEGKEYVYKIFMVGFVPSLDSIFFPDSIDYTEEEMKEYLEQLESYNIYHYDLDVSVKDKVLALTTCTRFFEADKNWKFYVVGRLERENEDRIRYSVSKTEKYQEIEEKLKGSEENEEV